MKPNGKSTKEAKLSKVAKSKLTFAITVINTT